MGKSTLSKMQTLLLMLLLAGALSACAAGATPTAAPEPKPTDAPTATSEAVTPTTETSPDFTGKVWEWQGTSMNDGTTNTPKDPSKYTIKFTNKGTAEVQADCNTGSGPYTVDNNKMTIGPIAITMMACPEGSLDSVYLQGLNDVGSYFMQGDNLILEIKMDSGSMKFAAAGGSSSGASGASGKASDLIGKSWQWQSTNMKVGGTFTTPPDPADYTIEFGVGGNVKVQADCNTGKGPYTLDGNNLTLGPFAMTMMACPEGSLDAQFMQNLGNVSSYLLEGNDLFLQLQDRDSGLMKFAPGK